MKLLGVNRDGDRLYSEWRLTYPVGWEHICKAAALIFEYTKDPEILTGDAGCETPAFVSGRDDILSLEESGCLTVRGTSDILRVLVMIVFYNQLDLVKAYVACATDEFSKADYKEFNLSMCQFMDSVELAMYR